MRSSSMIFLRRSSNSPRYLVPATSEPMSRVSTRLSSSVSGTSPLHDALRQPLGDGGLADAGLADQGRVVLRPAAQDLDDPLDLLLAADDRVELAGPRQLGQVDAELVEGRRLGRALRLLRRRHAGALAQDVDDLVANLVQVDAQALEHAGGDALALADQAEQQVLGTDVVVARAAAPRRWPARSRAWRAGVRPTSPTTGRSPRPMMNSTAVRTLESSTFMFSRTRAATPSPSRHQPEQQVLGADVVVVEALRLVLGKGQYLACPVRELVEAVHVAHLAGLLPGGPGWPRELGQSVEHHSRAVPSIGTTA